MKSDEISKTSATIHIASDADIIQARMAARDFAAKIGFNGVDLVMIATAVSEMARNIIEYARQGDMALSEVWDYDARRGLQVVASDHGPGIADLARAMENGYSTSRGFGLGLPGARNLMDDFSVETGPDRGTTVTMRKWLP